MTMSALQDQAATIRATTAAILLAAGTLAGDAVEQERIDPLQPGDAPRLVVFADQSGQTDSTAGTAVRFTVTCNLTIQALAQRSRLADVLGDLDTLVFQTKAALFCDPVFVTLASNIASVRVTSTYKDGGDWITGDARIQITMSWFETYQPNPTTVLSGLDVTTRLPGSSGPTIYSEFLTTGT